MPTAPTVNSSSTSATIVDADAHKLFPERRALQSSDGYVFTAPVGRFAANGFGLHDMHGNVWEWCADWHAAPPPLEKGAARGEESDPQGPAAGRDRVIRGGDWYHDWSFARSAQRFPIYPGLYRRHGGFRVVRESRNNSQRRDSVECAVALPRAARPLIMPDACFANNGLFPFLEPQKTASDCIAIRSILQQRDNFFDYLQNSLFNFSSVTS